MSPHIAYYYNNIIMLFTVPINFILVIILVHKAIPFGLQILCKRETITLDTHNFRILYGTNVSATVIKMTPPPHLPLHD